MASMKTPVFFCFLFFFFLPPVSVYHCAEALSVRGQGGKMSQGHNLAFSQTVMTAKFALMDEEEEMMQSSLYPASDLIGKP